VGYPVFGQDHAHWSAAFDVSGAVRPQTLHTLKGTAMSHESYELKAEARDRVGKGSSRALRRNGMIPAVIYGDSKPPVAISLPYKEVHLKLHQGGFKTTIATIDVGGEKIQVLPKDYQLDPVRDFTMHVDFLRIGKDTVVTVSIPVHFLNEEASPGLKRGGVLNIVRHDVEFTVPATAIPEYITADLTGLDIGDGIHISAITLPEGMKPTITDRDFTIATIAAPAALKSEEEEEAEAAEAAEAEEGEEGEEDAEGEEKAEGEE
jgi:large subunit ribosomal protein L25